MKTVTIAVDFKVEIPEDMDPNEITFEIPIEQVRVDQTGAAETLLVCNVGRVTGYFTQEYFGEE